MSPGESAGRARLIAIVADMQAASDAADEANGTSDYMARMVALALIARHFLREGAAEALAGQEEAPQQPTIADMLQRVMPAPRYSREEFERDQMGETGERLAARAKAKEDAPAPPQCEGECNPYLAHCGARFCSYEAMAAHDKCCPAPREPREEPR